MLNHRTYATTRPFHSQSVEATVPGDGSASLPETDRTRRSSGISVSTRYTRDARISGVGAVLPSRTVTTAEVEERVGICERFGLERGWLEHVSGVRTRRWGAFVVEATDDPDRGLRERTFLADPSKWRLALGGRSHPAEPCPRCDGVVDPRFSCDGVRLFSAVFALVPAALEEVMTRTGWTYSELDVAFCHEASGRYAETGLARLPEGRTIATKLWSPDDRLGNKHPR